METISADETWSTGFPREKASRSDRGAKGRPPVDLARGSGPDAPSRRQVATSRALGATFRKGERGFICLPLIPLLFAGLFGAALASDRKTVVVEKHVTGCRCEACSK